MEFDREERKAIVILGIVAGFVVGFDNMVSLNGNTISIDYTTGLLTVAVLCFGMMISVLWHELAHKMASKYVGYYTHITIYPAGAVLGVALSVFTFGWIQFFTPNAVDLEANPRARIAKHRKYENWKQEAFVAGAGIFATGIFAAGLQGMFMLTGTEFFRTLLLGNLWLMLYSLVPFELLNFAQLRFFQNIEQLPQSDGLYLLHYSHYAYIFVTTFALVTAGILYFTQSLALWLALVLAFLATIAVWWNIFKEMK
jgi:hypothetical protein